MSRRRAGDAAADALLPWPSVGSGKTRGIAARVARFVRAKPITALLAAICSLLATLATVALSGLVLRCATHVGGARKAAQRVRAAGAPLRDAGAARNASAGADTRCMRHLEAGRFGSEGKLCVTAEYFLDMSIAGKPAGRVTVGIFGRVAPKSAANFDALVTCAPPFDDGTCFRGDTFHRVVRGFVIQGGSKATGRSIYGGTFREEMAPDHHSVLSHSERGVLAYAEYPIGAQFYILLASEAKYLDKNHVVFGYVAAGMEAVDQVAQVALDGDRPVHRVSITDCGAVKQQR